MIGICQGETEIPRVLLAAEHVSWKQRCRHRSAGTNGLASLSQACIAVPRLHAPSADSSGNHTFLCGLALGRESPGQSQSNPRRWRPKIELGCKPPPPDRHDLYPSVGRLRHARREPNGRHKPALGVSPGAAPRANIAASCKRVRGASAPFGGATSRRPRPPHSDGHRRARPLRPLAIGRAPVSNPLRGA